MIIVFEKEFKKKEIFSSFRFQVQNKKIISVLKKIYVFGLCLLKRREHTYLQNKTKISRSVNDN